MLSKQYSRFLLISVAIILGFSIAISPVFADSKMSNTSDEEIIEEVENEYEDSSDEVDEDLEGLEGYEEDPNIPEIIGEVSEEENLVVDLNFGDATEFRVVVSNECSVVEKVTLKTTEAVQGKLKIVGHDENPSENDLEKSLGFCEFELIDIDPEKVELISWKLIAEREDLSENDYDKDSLKLMVLEEGKWKSKDTNRVDGDSDNFIYKADSDSFGEGTMAFASAKNSFFSTRNVLYCIGSLVGLALLLIVGYSLIDKSEGK